MTYCTFTNTNVETNGSVSHSLGGSWGRTRRTSEFLQHLTTTSWTSTWLHTVGSEPKFFWKVLDYRPDGLQPLSLIPASSQEREVFHGGPQIGMRSKTAGRMQGLGYMLYVYQRKKASKSLWSLLTTQTGNKDCRPPFKLIYSSIKFRTAFSKAANCWKKCSFLDRHPDSIAD